MSLRIDLRLPSLSAESRRRLEAALGQIPVPQAEIWVISIVENTPDEWILLVTGGLERPEASPQWAFVGAEDNGEGERVCSYSRRLDADAESAGAIARSIEELLAGPGASALPSNGPASLKRTRRGQHGAPARKAGGD